MFRMSDDKCRLSGAECFIGDHYDVWIVDLGRAASVRPKLHTLLDPEERRRAARFLRPEVGDRFAVARGVLRLLLGCYLAQDPARLRFVTGPFGKPYLRTGDAGASLDFNVSHSGDIAAYAFSGLGLVGVDVEWIRVVRDMGGLLRRVGTPEERRRFRQTIAPEQQRWFFRLWTRKEAVAKAIGEGMHLPFDRLEVMPEASRAAAIPDASRLSVPAGPNRPASAWAIRDFPFQAAYCGAIATPLELPGPVRLWKLDVIPEGRFQASPAGRID
jgi:4'-phosphopantetheinyl transferase